MPSWRQSTPSIMMRDPWSFFSYFRPTNQEPTEKLMEHIRNRDWDGTRRRAVTHPWDAQYIMYSGSQSTVLHLACLYRAPYDVIEVVLNAHPDALMATDTEGWTPLHVAFLYGADEETSLMLIRRGGANLAAMQGRLVGSPLHVACRHGVTNRVFEELLKANPSMATVANDAGAKPGKLLWCAYARNPANRDVIRELRTSGQVDKEDPSIAILLDRIHLLLNAVNGRDRCITTTCFVHEFVALQSELDLCRVLPLTVCMYPDQMSKADENGNLPLHIAASQPHPARPGQRILFDVPVRDAVEILVESCPSAARVANGRGQLPIHLALRKGRRTWNSGIASLVQAAPSAIMTPDIQTQLYPFQLAAAHEADDELESLNTIYQLLLAWPTVLQ